MFRENTRQARVEVRIANPELRLKPGLFARLSVVLQRLEDATIVPQQALVRRDAGSRPFLLSPDRTSVAWRTVEAGLRDGERVQITGAGLDGHVVVLGQQLLDDGSAVAVSGKPSP